MDILKQAIDTAEAIGITLTKTERLTYDVLQGYDFNELAQFCDNKALTKLIKSAEKDVLTQRVGSLYLKPITLSDTIYIVLGKTTDNNLVVCRKGDDYRVAFTPLQKGIKLTTDDEITDEFREYHAEVVARLDFAKKISNDLEQYKLDKCDETTNWEIGKEYYNFKEKVLDTSTNLAWGFEFFKAVYGVDGDERVIPCLLLKESVDLKLLKHFG